jgi:hypothetical protein
MTLLEFCRWLEDTPMATAIAESDWLFPGLEAIHVVALTTVVGSIAMVDLRLLSVLFRNVDCSRLIQHTLPVTWVAFAFAVASGFFLFASAATNYLENGPFRYKLLLILLAGVNMAIFHFVTGKRLTDWIPPRMPAGAKFAGAASLLLWTGAVVLGRWIAFA